MSDDGNGKNKIDTEHREEGQCHMVVKAYSKLKSLDSYCFCNTPAVYTLRLPDDKAPRPLEEEYAGKFCRNHYLMLKAFPEIEEWLIRQIELINENRHECQKEEE